MLGLHATRGTMRAMWTPRSLVLLAVSSLTLTGCLSSAPPAEVPTRPERLVMVAGEKSDAIGIERGRDASHAVVEVAFHDGARAWVEDWRVRDLDLSPGARVVETTSRCTGACYRNEWLAMIVSPPAGRLVGC